MMYIKCLEHCMVCRKCAIMLPSIISLYVECMNVIYICFSLAQSLLDIFSSLAIMTYAKM